MSSTVRTAAALAIGGLLITAVVGAAAEPVEVTGESDCVQVGDGVFSGEPVSGLPGAHLSDYFEHCITVTSDERFSGEADNAIVCDFVVEDETTIGECWGTATMQNELGAWAGVISGTTTWSDTAPAHVHVMDLDYLGAGDYEGLRFKGIIEGSDYPWIITGTIEGAE